MSQVYQENIHISFYETDVNNDIRIPDLIAIAMTISGRHSRALGLSDDWLFERYQLVWVVTEHQLQINRLPIYNETIRIETKIKSYNRFFCYRGFEIYSDTGELLVTILSTFVLINTSSRQLVGIPEEVLDPFKTMFEKKPLRSPKLKTLENGEETDYKIRYFDLDLNGHVNNSRYLEWVYDGLTLNFIAQHVPKQLIIKYNKEISPDQSVKIRTQLDDLVSQHDFSTENQLCTQVQIHWRKRKVKDV